MLSPALRSYCRNFNPLPRKEGDVKVDASRCKAGNFNPLPRKEGDLQGLRMRSWDTDFNPLPRKEGDCQHKKVLFIAAISIHSLVKRETLSKFAGVLQRNISIHSLVKRETCRNYTKCYGDKYFNPLPRKEGDISRV